MSKKTFRENSNALDFTNYQLMQYPVMRSNLEHFGMNLMTFDMNGIALHSLLFFLLCFACIASLPTLFWLPNLARVYFCFHFNCQLFTLIFILFAYLGNSSDCDLLNSNLFFSTTGAAPEMNQNAVQMQIQGKNLGYRSGTANSNTVNSKFHLIRSLSEDFARFLSFHV